MTRIGRLLAGLLFAAVCFGQVNPYFGRGVWRGWDVDFRIVDGWAIAQGDIIIGRAAEVAARYRSLLAAPTAEAKNRLRESTAVADRTRLWPGGVVPYEIDPAFRDTSTFDAAIRHWNDRTSIRLVPRNGEPNYVRFSLSSDPNTCGSSALGMAGGVQFILGTETCPAPALIHEIGHAVGLDHEQVRSDRDRYVRILWENIAKAFRPQYQAFDVEQDLGPYDYYSIMHYGVGDGSAAGAAMETLPPGIPIKQGLALSDGDIDAVARLYGTAPSAFTISSTPPGLQVTVDGQAVTTPKSFPWDAGSTHTVEAAPVQSDDYGRYEFARWSDGGDRAHGVTVQAAGTIYIAHFVRYNRFDFRALPAEAGTVTISPASPDGYYREGTPIFVQANANPGYGFRSWSGPYLEANLVQNLAVNPYGMYAHGKFQGLTANFAPLAGTGSGGSKTIVRFASAIVSGQSAGGLVRVDGKQYSMPAAFGWDPGSTHDVQVDASFPNGIDQSLLVFRGWDDGGDRVRQVTATDQPAIYTARYAVKYSVQALGLGGGSVAVDPVTSDSYYELGTTVQLQASASGSNRFVGWGRDAGGTANPKPMAMTSTMLVFGFFAAPGAVSAQGVMNAASQRTDLQLVGDSSYYSSISPGEPLIINVPGFGPDSQTDAAPGSDGLLPSNVAGMRALFGGVPAPLLSVAKDRVMALAPYGLSTILGRGVGIQLEYQGVRTASGVAGVVAANPAVYTADGSGTGQAAVLNDDGSPNSPFNPAKKGSLVTFLANGLGVTDPPTADGRILNDYGAGPAGKLEVRIGGAVANVIGAALAPGQAGVYRIQAQVPDAARAGAATPLVVTLDGAPSQLDVTMAVQ